MDYNLLLYIGVGLMLGGFGLWLFSEMRIRQIDRQLAENQRFIDAMMRVKKWETLLNLIGTKSKELGIILIIDHS